MGSRRKRGRKEGGWVGGGGGGVGGGNVGICRWEEERERAHLA